LLPGSQPLDPKLYGTMDEQKITEAQDEKIISQRMGTMLDDLDDNYKIDLKTRMKFTWRDIKGRFYDIRYILRNLILWCKTLSQIRPWEGFSGLILVMQAHLKDYVANEEKYGHSEPEYKTNKIATAKETIEILERMKEPLDYSIKRRDEIEAKYPKYKHLVTKYERSVGYSGEFVPQAEGWAGEESGKEPRRGYFEFIDGRFEQTASPDQTETDRILAELDRYNQEIHDAYERAEKDSDADFDRLAVLLKNNLYQWWD